MKKTLLKRIVPDRIYAGMPCSVVAVGCAMKLTDIRDVKDLFGAALTGQYGPKLHEDGYLSLDGLNGLIRAYLSVKRRVSFKRGERPTLRDFTHGFGGRAVICLEGHYIYLEHGKYYSYFLNGDDKVVEVWYLE